MMTFRSRRHRPSALILKIILCLVTLAALFFASRWLWFKWRAFGGVLIPWWRETIADPILRFILHIFIASGGDVLLAMIPATIAVWLLSKLLFGSVLQWSVGRGAKHSRVAVEHAITSMEDIDTRLRKMFGGDVERIAFYETRLETPKGSSSPKRHKFVGGGGCLVGLLWAVVMTPVNIAVNVAFFHGVLSLFGGRADPDRLLAAVGPQAQTLENYLPLATQFMGIDLQERSLLLVILLLVISLLYWICENISPSGRTLPSLSPWWVWASVPLLAILCYLILNGALILFSCLYLTIHLLQTAWKRLIWERIHLPLRARLYRSKESRARPRQI